MTAAEVPPSVHRGGLTAEISQAAEAEFEQKEARDLALLLGRTSEILKAKEGLRTDNRVAILLGYDPGRFSSLLNGRLWGSADRKRLGAALGLDYLQLAIEAGVAGSKQ